MSLSREKYGDKNGKMRQHYGKSRCRGAGRPGDIDPLVPRSGQLHHTLSQPPTRGMHSKLGAEAMSSLTWRTSHLCLLPTMAVLISCTTSLSTNACSTRPSPRQRQGMVKPGVFEQSAATMKYSGVPDTHKHREECPSKDMLQLHGTYIP